MINFLQLFALRHGLASNCNPGGRGTGGTGPTDQGNRTQRQTLAETDDQKPDNKTNGLEVPKILIIQYVPYEAYSILLYTTQNGF